MRCDEADALLDAYAEEALDAAQRGAVDAHLAACARCRAAVAASRALGLRLAALPLVEPSAAVDRRIADAVAEEIAWSRRRARTRAVAAAAALLVTATTIALATSSAPEHAVAVGAGLARAAVAWLRSDGLNALVDVGGVVAAAAVLVLATTLRPRIARTTASAS